MVSTPTLEKNWQVPRQKFWGVSDIPEEIRPSVEQMQLQRALSHVPMIYVVAIFNLILVMILSANNGVNPLYYSWMGVFAIVCAIRMFMRIRYQRKSEITLDTDKSLRNLALISVSTITFLSCWSVFSIVTDMFANLLFIPMGLVFGSTCIAHWLASIRKAAVGILFIGVVPSGLALTAFGGADEIIMGCSMITIAILMIRFITDSYNQIISGLIMEQTIWKLAHSDALTGLANRRAMMDHLEQAEVGFAQEDTGFAVALLDLNSFKQVNDNWGHDVGDELLVEVADRLSRIAKEGEIVGRLGGDEFLVFIPGVDTHEQASIRATAFLSVLAEPAEIKGHILTPSASIGFAIQAVDGSGSKQLLKAADRALYEMKRTGKSARKGVANKMRDAA